MVSTAFTAMFGLTKPVALAPMGGAAGGALAAAVSNGGGLGRLIVQVTDIDEARRALDLGADVIVARAVELPRRDGLLPQPA